MAAKGKQMLYTQEGYQTLVDELDYLKGTKRQQVKEDIATARSFGDLRKTPSTMRRGMNRPRWKQELQSWRN